MWGCMLNLWVQSRLMGHQECRSFRLFSNGLDANLTSLRSFTLSISTLIVANALVISSCKIRLSTFRLLAKWTDYSWNVASHMWRMKCKRIEIGLLYSAQMRCSVWTRPKTKYLFNGTNIYKATEINATRSTKTSKHAKKKRTTTLKQQPYQQ